MNLNDEIIKKLEKAWSLSDALIFVPDGRGDWDTRDLFTLFGEDVAGRVEAHSEGTYMRHIMKIMAGKCSLKATMDFDIAETEAKLDHEIEEFSGYCAQLGINIPTQSCEIPKKD